MKNFKYRWPVLLAFLLCVGALGTYIRFSAYAAESQSGAGGSVTMDVTYGYGETAKGDRYLPVRVNLSNMEDSEFEGTLELLTLESSFEVYRYDYPVSIGRSGEYQEVYYVPLGVKGDQIYVTLKDKDEKQVIRKRLKLNVGNEVSELFIGVLSDTPERLQYIDGVGINYGSLRTRIVPMEADTFPSDSLGLDLLDVILISNYDTGRLSEGQQEAIMEWVKKGGTLLLGTGERAADTLKRFEEGLVETPYGPAQVDSVNFGAEFATKAPGDSFVELPCVDLTLVGGGEVMGSDTMPLLSAVAKGNGSIAVAAYDFVDIEDFCRNQPSYMEKVLVALMGEQKVLELAQADYYGYSNLYYSVLSLINTGSVERLPDLLLYAVVIILYIALIGPGFYFFLRHRGLQKWYMKAIIVCSVCFTGVIYMMGAKTRFQSAFFSYATIQDASKNRVQDTTYINVRNPYNNPYSVDISPEYTIRPITKSYYYDMTAIPKFTGNEGYQVALQKHNDKTTIQIRDTVAFTPKLFSLTKRESNPEAVGFEGDITMFDGVISGTVTNRFSFPVENAALLLYGKLVYLGDLQAGETKDLEGAKLFYYPASLSYHVAQMITGADQYEKADISDPDYIKAQDRSNLLSFYMSNYLDGYTPKARVVAFSQDTRDLSFVASGQYPSDGIKMLTSEVDVNTESDGYLYRSGFVKKPNVISGNYQPDFNYMYGMDPVILEYSLGNDLDVEKVIFEYLSPELMEDQKNSYMQPFNGKISLYNYNSGQYDLMDSKKAGFDREELKPYLSPGNTMTVKYVYESNGDYQMSIILPMISVIGREK